MKNRTTQSRMGPWPACGSKRLGQAYGLFVLPVNKQFAGRAGCGVLRLGIRQPVQLIIGA